MASLLSTARLFPAGLGFAADLLQEADYPWEVLPLIGKYVRIVNIIYTDESGSSFFPKS